MTNKEYSNVQDDLIYLVSCAVNEEVPTKERIDAMDLSAVFYAAKWHRLTVATALALESAGINNPAFTQEKEKILCMTLLRDVEMDEILTLMEESEIWYMPLKGAILKDLYPQFGMREMGDCDILFDGKRSEEVKRIMESRGFTTILFGDGIQDVYSKKPIYRFEMHIALFRPSYHNENLCAYYQDVEDRLMGIGYKKQFTPEDLYLFNTAHAYSHYVRGGTGLRSFLDSYVYLQKNRLNMNYVEAEAEKLGIANFEKHSRILAMRLFQNKELTDADRKMLAYVFSSGVYGTKSHEYENKLKRSGTNKVHYMLNRFLVPINKNDKRYNDFAREYSLFYNHKILLPVLPFYRLFRSMEHGHFKAEYKAILKAKK